MQKVDDNSVNYIVMSVKPLVGEDKPPGYPSWRLVELLTNVTVWEVEPNKT